VKGGVVPAVALVLVFLVLSASSLNVQVVFGVTQQAIDKAVEKTLAYLAQHQDVSGAFEDPQQNYPCAITALAVLAFENFGHFASNDPAVDPYAVAVKKGLDYLTSSARQAAIGQKPAGNPDTNGNGKGAYWDSGGNHEIYETPMVVMALVASNTPDMNITTGAYAGRTYRDLVQDAVDLLAYAQSTASSSRGGWRYMINSNDADNSVSQWPAIGLRAAEYWGVYAPEFVKSELWYWINASQNMDPASNQFGGFWYTPSSFMSDGIPATGAGICEMDYAGANVSHVRIQHALLFLNKFWNSSYNLGFLYAMYAVMKACRDATPPVLMVGSHDWYSEYAEWLVEHQTADGTWPSSAFAGPVMDAAFGALILNKALIYGHYSVTVVVTDQIGSPLEDVLIVLDNSTNQTKTNSDGVGVFKNVARGNHTFDLSKSGYNPVSIVENITQDTVISVTLESPEPYAVTVEVSDMSGHAVSDVNVTIDGLSGLTGVDGKAGFVNVARGNYSINASKAGYDPFSAVQQVYRNATIPISLYSGQIVQPDMMIDLLEYFGVAALGVADIVAGALYFRARRKLKKSKKT
jgi:hypothetical protein